MNECRIVRPQRSSLGIPLHGLLSRYKLTPKIRSRNSDRKFLLWNTLLEKSPHYCVCSSAVSHLDILGKPSYDNADTAGGTSRTQSTPDTSHVLELSATSRHVGKSMVEDLCKCFHVVRWIEHFDSTMSGSDDYKPPAALGLDPVDVSILLLVSSAAPPPLPYPVSYAALVAAFAILLPFLSRFDSPHPSACLA